MTQPFLELKSVVKKYAGTTAVNHVSLSVPKGCIFGLLGPNGAGKTSLIRMITTITAPDSGEILIQGQPLREADTENMGYMPEERGLYRKMKVREQIEYLLRLKGKTAAEARKITFNWMKDMEITSWENKKISDLSKGMSQKVQFIGTVAHNPSLIILDEPFSGLDPINAHLIEKKMLELKAKGHTIIFSTHRMEQVEEFCDHIALINQGRILIEGEVNEVRKRYQKNHFRVWYKGEESAFAAVSGIAVLERKPNNLLLELMPGHSQRELLKQLAVLDVDIERFEHILPRLNEIFIEVVNNSANAPVHA